MFDSPRIITTQIERVLGHPAVELLWKAIQDMPAEKDYLQVFELTKLDNDTWQVIHTQEEPPYRNEFILEEVPMDQDASEMTVFVIDDGPVCTMLFDDEY